MFGVVYEPVSIDPAESFALMRRYPDWLCQDWQCPSHCHCGKHFGLSKRYAAMGEMQPGDALVVPDRDGAQCAHYAPATVDHFAASLGQTALFGQGGNA